MPDVVNDALGMAQFVTTHLSENKAVSYLLAIEGISFEQWKTAKDLLPNADRTARQTKEKTIKDIVQVFQSEETNIRYWIDNYTLIPGFQIQALELASFAAASLYSVSTVSSRIIEEAQKEKEEKEKSYPPLYATTASTSHPSALTDSSQINTAPPTVNLHWKKPTGNTYVRRKPEKQLKSNENNWIHGTN